MQGSGKTTSVAKLARWLKERKKKSVLVASADVYRPAAIEQLQTLGSDEVGARCFSPAIPLRTRSKIAQGAIAEARRRFVDVVIVDTAGRLHVDAAMMDEIKRLHAAVQPVETLFVVDSMTGQDAANTARAFNDALPLTGVVLTKADGDARGGAALSVRTSPASPSSSWAWARRPAPWSPSIPSAMASRILGMGDVLSLIEKAEQTVDRKQAEQVAKKLKKGKGFDLEDFRDQFGRCVSMGGMGALLETLPGGGALPRARSGPARRPSRCSAWRPSSIP